MKSTEAQKAYQAKWRREDRAKNPEKYRSAAKERYREKKDTILEQGKRYREANKEQISKRRQTRYFSHQPEVRKHNALKANYGIGLDEYQTMYEAQNGCCGICFKPYETLDVDHDHVTNEVRGLLCQRCNKGIGLLLEDETILKSAITYLGKKKK